MDVFFNFVWNRQTLIIPLTMSKSQLFLGVQNQSPSITQILTRNFEQAFDKVNDLIFGPILIWNWIFLSPLQLCKRQFPQILLLKSCFNPNNATRSKLSAVLRHCFLCCLNAVALGPQYCGIGYFVNFLPFWMPWNFVLNAAALKLLSICWILSMPWYPMPNA